MKIIALILACLLLPACETCREHPGACALVTSVVVTSVALCAGGRHHDRAASFPMSEPLTYPGIKPVDCTTGQCQ
jgi:hypothetical protein